MSTMFLKWYILLLWPTIASSWIVTTPMTNPWIARSSSVTSGMVALSSSSRAFSEPASGLRGWVGEKSWSGESRARASCGHTSQFMSSGGKGGNSNSWAGSSSKSVVGGGTGSNKNYSGAGKQGNSSSEGNVRANAIVPTPTQTAANKTRSMKAVSGVAAQPLASLRRTGRRKFSARVPTNFSARFNALNKTVNAGRQPPLHVFGLLLKKISTSAHVGFEWPTMQRGREIFKLFTLCGMMPDTDCFRYYIQLAAKRAWKGEVSREELVSASFLV